MTAHCNSSHRLFLQLLTSLITPQNNSRSRCLTTRHRTLQHLTIPCNTTELRTTLRITSQHISLPQYPVHNIFFITGEECWTGVVDFTGCCSGCPTWFQRLRGSSYLLVNRKNGANFIQRTSLLKCALFITPFMLLKMSFLLKLYFI